MAHFAKIENDVVVQVIVVDNKDTADANGVEKEYIGAAFCERLLGGTWKQTSYNGNFRKNYAGLGYTYDAARDAFIPPKPSDDATLDEATCQWIVPAIELSLGANSSESGDSI
jgi:murein DD-endopeptidase MepM/ murein hydrolase activator NlpD